jgi:glutamate formiminotransferase/formiminotetrahydrofolate cyclodeaminase
LNLREAGRGPGQPGRLQAVQGMGWFVQEYNLAQVTCNLTDYRVTPLHTLYEAVQKEAEQLNVGVAGSEIVGVVPLEAILMTADHYSQKENLLIYQQDQLIRLAVQRLGLNSITAFNPAEKIIEIIVAEPPDEPLAGMSLRGFIEAVAARGSAPGGGSVAAAAAAMGVALAAMTAKLTYGVRKYEDVDSHMRQAIPVLHQTCMQLIPLVDADTRAYNAFMAGLRMPRQTEAQQAARSVRMQAGLKNAAEVPLQTMRLADRAWDALCTVARYGKKDCLSDIQVGAKALETGIWGAAQNVRINVQGIADQAYKAESLEQVESLVARAAEKCAKVLKILSMR